MNRCDYCLYNNVWDCSHGWDRLDNNKMCKDYNKMCKDFILDFENLSEKQKKKIQKNLMKQDW